MMKSRAQLFGTIVLHWEHVKAVIIFSYDIFLTCIVKQCIAGGNKAPHRKMLLLFCPSYNIHSSANSADRLTDKE